MKRRLRFIGLALLAVLSVGAAWGQTPAGLWRMTDVRPSNRRQVNAGTVRIDFLTSPGSITRKLYQSSERADRVENYGFIWPAEFAPGEVLNVWISANSTGQPFPGLAGRILMSLGGATITANSQRNQRVDNPVVRTLIGPPAPSAAGATVNLNVSVGFGDPATDYVVTYIYTWMPTPRVPSPLTVTLNPAQHTMASGEQVTIRASVAGGEPPYLSYEWTDNGRRSAAKSNSVWFKLSEPGEHSIAVTVTDSANRTAAGRATVDVQGGAPTAAGSTSPGQAKVNPQAPQTNAPTTGGSNAGARNPQTGAPATGGTSSLGGVTRGQSQSPPAGTPAAGGGPEVRETAWYVNGVARWVFHANGTAEHPGVWKGTWKVVSNGYWVELMQQGVTDSFLVQFSPDGKKLTAIKDGKVYRQGNRVP
jgi:hypothetical protein